MAVHTYQTDDDVLQAALCIAEGRLQFGDLLTSPTAASDYLRLKLSGLEVEVFGAVWLTAEHRAVSVSMLSSGSIDSASVPMRVVVKAALEANASACILFHNHPSGNETPSQADVNITVRLKDVLGMIDVRVLDHLIVGRGVASLAELGRI